jgi:spore germination protein YaaH
MDAALSSVVANSDLWSEVSPFWYSATSATTIAGTGDPAVVATLHGRGLPVVPTVTETLNAPQMRALLADAASRAALRDQLVTLAVDNGYDGIDLDFEAMNFGGTSSDKAAIATSFLTFLSELNAALHAQGKLLSVVVGPHTSASDPNWAVFDYAGIGSRVDRFRILTYDFHYRGGDPGAIAPLPWTESVVAYAVSVVPHGKVQLGVPLYGYDWPTDGAHHSIGTAASLSTYGITEALRIGVAATRQYSSADAAPYFTYRDGSGTLHEVWYNDEQSTRAKMTLVGKYGLKGMAFWHVSGEDSRQWAAIRTYAIQKSTTLSASAPSVVTYGTTLTVTGKLTATTGGAAVAGATVHLQRNTTGTWSTVGSPAKTSSTGTVSFPYKPAVNGQFRLVADSSWAYAGRTSAAVTTSVRWKVTAAFTHSTVRRGTAAVLKGTVGPARSGTRVERQRLVNGSWVLVAATTTSSTGAYTFTFTWKTAGKYTYRIVVPGTSKNATGTSPSRTLTVS